MTFPFRRSSQTYVSSANEAFRVVLPADIQQGDIIIIYYAGDGNLSTLLATTGDLQGYNLYSSYIVSSSLVHGVIYKPANGDEGGQTLFAGTSPNERWCISVNVFGDTEQYLVTGARFDTNTGSSNPNPGVIPTAAGDRAYLLTLAGEGTTAITAQPSGYTLVHNLTNASAEGVVLGFAEKFANVASEDPGVWTRASAPWVATSMSWRGRTTDRHPRFARQDSQVLSGGTKNYTVNIPVGTHRRFFALLNAASSTVSSIVLDPSGLNLPLSVVTDGVTNAETGTAGTARASTWYTLDSSLIPAAGAYTLRVITSVTGDCALQSMTLVNAQQGLLVHAVAVGTTSGTIAAPPECVVLSTAVQPLSLHPSNDIIWESRTGLTQMSTWSPPHFMSSFALRVATGPTASLTFESAGGLAAEAFATFTLLYDTELDLEEEVTLSEALDVEGALATTLEEELTISESLELGVIFEVEDAAATSSTQVRVDFTSAYDTDEGLTPSNYTIPGLDVIGVSPASSKSVILTTTPQDPELTYTVTVSEDVEGFGGDPLDPENNIASFEGYSATSFTARAQSPQKVQLTFSNEMDLNEAFTDPSNYTLIKVDGTSVTVTAVEATGLENSHASLTLGDSLEPNNTYNVTVSPNVRTIGDDFVSPDTAIFTWTPYAPSPIVLDFERFSGEVSGGLLGQPAGQVFFSPAFEQSAANSILEVDQVSVCTRAYDTYEFPELPDPPILYTFPAPNSPQTSSLLNGTTILFAPAERQGLARVNLTCLPEDAYTPPVDGPADATLVETIDITRAGFLNDVRWETFPADTAEIGVFTTADNLTPIGPGPTSNINLQP